MEFLQFELDFGRSGEGWDDREDEEDVGLAMSYISLTGLCDCRWDKKAWDAAQEAQKAENEKFGPDAPTLPKGDRKSLAEQAKALLEGKIVWRPSWRDYGRAREVEVDVDVNEGGAQAGTAMLSRRGNASTAGSS